MKPPEDPLQPMGHCFAEPWHAQVLATAQSLIRASSLDANDWAKALGQALKDAEAQNAPDTEETYYAAALTALERVAPITEQDLNARKSDWEDAYRRTPHGQPVTLSSDTRSS